MWRVKLRRMPRTEVKRVNRTKNRLRYALLSASFARGTAIRKERKKAKP
jgi:hypothetical protein